LYDNGATAYATLNTGIVDHGNKTAEYLLTGAATLQEQITLKATK